MQWLNPMFSSPVNGVSSTASPCALLVKIVFHLDRFTPSRISTPRIISLRSDIDKAEDSLIFQSASQLILSKTISILSGGIASCFDVILDKLDHFPVVLKDRTEGGLVSDKEYVVREHCDIAEISIRFDYKPKRIDFRKIALGKYAELLNFFQLEDAELTLPAVRLRGVKGADHFAAELLRSWLPYIKNSNQIPKMMLNGISPVRTVVRLGGGVSDLILLPMQQYKKDGRVIRGLRKGTASFLHSTTLEGARIGSRLASGTQVILEQLDDVFEPSNGLDEEEEQEGRLVQQPEDVREGLLSAYQSLSTNLNEAVQTIIAAPIQVFEKAGTGGAVKAVIRAVPVAILKPMIGTAQAVGQTLQGVENTLDISKGIEIKQKYKGHRRP